MRRFFGFILSAVSGPGVSSAAAPAEAPGPAAAGAALAAERRAPAAAAGRASSPSSSSESDTAPGGGAALEETGVESTTGSIFFGELKQMGQTYRHCFSDFLQSLLLSGPQPLQPWWLDRGENGHIFRQSLVLGPTNTQASDQQFQVSCVSDDIIGSPLGWNHVEPPRSPRRDASPLPCSTAAL